MTIKSTPVRRQEDLPADEADGLNGDGRGPASLEESHVHRVYDKIAAHFSATRYATWPVVSAFLEARAAGSVGADVGCGNGKYLSSNPSIVCLGSDRSEGLVRLARDKVTSRGTAGSDVVLADGLATPHRPGSLDFCLSIAVIHHFSTRTRRIEAIRHLLDLLRSDGGEALVYVWALEQKTSRRGWGAGDPQDIMVPWATMEDGKEVVYERFYHLFRQGELEEDVGSAGGRVVSSGYDRDNWWVVMSKK